MAYFYHFAKVVICNSCRIHTWTSHARAFVFVFYALL